MSVLHVLQEQTGNTFLLCPTGIKSKIHPWGEGSLSLVGQLCSECSIPSSKMREFVGKRSLPPSSARPYMFMALISCHKPPKELLPRSAHSCGVQSSPKSGFLAPAHSLPGEWDGQNYKSRFAAAPFFIFISFRPLCSPSE